MIYDNIGDHDIIKPKHITIQVKDKDNIVIDTINSRTLDYYECKYIELYNLIERLKVKFWDDLGNEKEMSKSAYEK